MPVAGQSHQARGFESFVALGDSFTEGVGDPFADGSGCRGWADRFAIHLAGRWPGLGYANLAIRGKLVGDVLGEQVPAAIAMAPDLVSLAAGGNDLLKPRSDPDEVAATFEASVAGLTRAGCAVLAFTGFDPKAFPVLRLMRGKAAVFSMHVREIASRYQCLLGDLWSMPILADRRLWAPDRLHLAPEGHRRVALRACEAVGIPVRDDWRAALPDEPGGAGRFPGTSAWLSDRWQDVKWATEHAAPYLSRRLHGVSSGDGRVAKRPELLGVDGADGAGRADPATSRAPLGVRVHDRGSPPAACAERIPPS
jgi:lysophospholipase L1-like esterase